MNLVDSSGWLEYLSNGGNAGYFAKVLENTNELIIPSLCVFEVFKRVLSQKGDSQAIFTAALMQQGKVVDLNLSIAISAANISCEMKLPMADSIILATAKLYNAVLWTQDSDFQGMDHVKFIAHKK